MFLRLCVVLLALSVQSVLAQDRQSEFETQLNSYQEKFPKDCKITSPAMKLVYACSRIQMPEANPRFYGIIEAGAANASSRSSGGVNFCYNSLVNVERNGDQLKVSVLRDRGASPERRSYIASRSGLKQSGGDIILPLAGLEGQCFGYTETVDGYCKSLLGGRTNGVPMGLVLNVHGDQRQSLTADRGALSEASVNESRASASTEVNRDEANKNAIAYARAQLVARAKQNMSPNNPNAPRTLPYPGSGPNPDQSIANYRQCDEMLIRMENSMNSAPKASPEDEKTLAEYRRRISPSAGATTPGTTPGTGSASGMREGAGGR